MGSSSHRSRWVTFSLCGVLTLSLVVNIVLLARRQTTENIPTRSSVDRVPGAEHGFLQLPTAASGLTTGVAASNVPLTHAATLPDGAPVAMSSHSQTVRTQQASRSPPLEDAPATGAATADSRDRSKLASAVLGDLADVKRRAPALLDAAMVREEASLPEVPSDDDVTQALARVVGTVSTHLLPALLDAQLPPAPYTSLPGHLRHHITEPATHSACSRVVVGLTTLPSRVAHLTQTIASIASQGYPVDAIHLAIPPFALRKGQAYWLPKWILEHPLVHVVPLPADYGPASKLFGALFAESDADTCIITLDDDASVPPHTVIKLVDAAQVLPSSAIGFSGWNITCASSLACWQWGGWNYHYIRSAHDDVCEREWKDLYGEHHCGLAVKCGAHSADVLMGVTGVLYRRWAFNESALDLLPQFYRDVLPVGLQPQRAHWLDETARRLIALADDVWLSTWLARVGVRRAVVPDPRQAAQGGCPTLGLYYAQQQLATAARKFAPVTLDIEHADWAVAGATAEQAAEACSVGCSPVLWLDMNSHEPVPPPTPQQLREIQAGGKEQRVFPVAVGIPRGTQPPVPMPHGVDPPSLIEGLWTALQEDQVHGQVRSVGNKIVTLDRIRHFPVDVMDSLHGHKNFDLFNKLVVFWAMAHGNWEGRWVPNDFYKEPIDVARLPSAYAGGYAAWTAAKEKSPGRRGGLGQTKLPADAFLAAFRPAVVPGVDKRGWHWMAANETLSSAIFLHGGESTNMQADMERVGRQGPPAWWPPRAWDFPPPLHSAG